jgi:hypothetical protein
VLDSGGSNLNVDVAANAADGSGPNGVNGLEVTLNQFGAAPGGADIRITDQYLGTTGNVVGDVEVVGLDVNGTTVTVSGK